MKVYTDNDNQTINIVQSVASASTLISSVTSEVKKYLHSKFPKDFFKATYVDTSETLTEQKKNDKYNNLASKKPYPIMTITPEISLDDPIGGMDKSMHLSSPNLYLRKDLSRVQSKLLLDPDDEITLYYTADYITTNFNISIITNSFIRSTDLAFFLKSKFQEGFFQYLNERPIDMEIPKSFIKAIADIKGYDLNNDEDMDNLRLYLIAGSRGADSIKKRVNFGTGKVCFFSEKLSNLLVLFTDLDVPSSVVRDSQVEGDYTITFRLQVSTYLPNAFILQLSRNALCKCDETTVNELESDFNQQDEGFYTTAIRSNIGNKRDMIYFTDSYGNEQTGQLIYTEQFSKKLGQYESDVYLFQKMNPITKKVHKYAIDNGIDITSLFHIQAHNANGPISPVSNNILIDYDEFHVTFYDKTESNIVVVVYVNRLLFESILENIKNDRFYFNSGNLTTILSNIDGYSMEHVVKAFENSREMNSTDLNKSLRVHTIYGTGYVSLLDDFKEIVDKETGEISYRNFEDSYKICVGIENGEPIIKRLEIR